ncbi:MAG: Uma2 family endonuclease [Blastocatellia bacterium]
MATVITTKQTIVMHEVSWTTYENLLSDLKDQSSPRLTYDRGMLEIISPTREHEEYNGAIAQLIRTVAEEMSIDVLGLGSTTYRREDLLRGFEPDSSFYIQSLDRVAGKKDINLSVDPPPDLVVELDITRNSLDKLALYAEMSVPEIWRYDGQKLTIVLLNNVSGVYHESDRSSALPVLTGLAIANFVEQARSLRSTAWLKAIREWTRTTPKR